MAGASNLTVNRVRLTPLFSSTVPALAVRITENGHKSFILAARFPGSRNQTRRYLGDAEGPRALSLSGARRRARNWLAKIGEGVDPKDEIRRPLERQIGRLLYAPPGPRSPASQATSSMPL